MAPPSPQPKEDSWRTRLDWKVLVISRKTIYAWIGIISFLILTTLLLHFFLKESSMAERAKEEIISAEKSMNKASSAGAEIFSYDKYLQASRELTKARRFFDAGDFKTAYDHAVSARSLARRAEMQLLEGQSLTATRFAIVSGISGKVEIKRSKDLSWQPASPGMKLSADDQIRTFSNSQIQIAFDDASILQMKPDSLIVMGNLSEDVITRAKKSSIRLMVSSIEAKIRKSGTKASEFKIEMPTAVAQVERANLAVQVTPQNESRIQVYSGTADVSSGGKAVRVKNNEEVKVTKDHQISYSPIPLVASPTLIAPINMKLLTFPNPQQGKVALTWKEVPGAKAYHLEIAQDQFFFDPISDLKPLYGVLHEIERLEGGTYFWRVSSFNNQGSEGGFSEPEIFQVQYAAEGLPFRIDALLVLVGRQSNTLYIQGTTEQFASVNINQVSIQTDENGRFRTSFKRLPEGKFLIHIQVVSKKGEAVNFQKEIPIGI